jgi:hypothetical protein
MAVVNKYVSANYNNSTGKLLDRAGLFGPGVVTQEAIAWFQPVSTDSVGSIYRLFKGIPSDVIITNLQMLNDAWTNCTSINIGLYNVLDWDGVGAIVGTGDQLLSGYNPSGGNPASSGWVSVLTNLSIANRIKSLWEVAAQAEYPPKFAAFDIALTTVTNSGSATPNIAVKLSYVRGV